MVTLRCYVDARYDLHMPQPLPVDVVSTWLDYFVVGADVLAGLGAAGALIVASAAYSRQIDPYGHRPDKAATILL
jgi:hypothetical protein